MRPNNPYENNYAPGWNPCLDAATNPYGSYVPMNEEVMPISEPAPMCPQGTVPYTIEEGDTLYNIARMYGTSVADIVAANPGITEVSMLYIGQMICVPTPAMRPCPTGSMSYTVMPGDTLTSIAERFSVSVYSLVVANPGFSPDNLISGMRLCIAPFACLPACVESERYQIAEDEDLMKLADSLQVTTDDILRANPFMPPCWFVPGRSICLPANANVPPNKKRR